MARFMVFVVLLFFWVLPGTASETSDSNNNQAPNITVLSLSTFTSEVSVSELAQIGTVLALVQVHDGDTGPEGSVSCAIPSDTTVTELQKLDSTTYSVLLSTNLDREYKSSYHSRIVCLDHGLPPLTSTASLTLHVLDENDNSPSFSVETFNMVVSEDMPIDTEIGEVKAVDVDIGDNGAIRYSLSAAQNEDEDYLSSAFWMDSSSGRIYTARSLDRELVSHGQFVVTATDNGSPSHSGTATVSITVLDVNDNAPYILPISEIRISRDTPADTELATLRAVDRDQGQNGQVTFSWMYEGTENPFSLSAEGMLSLVDIPDAGLSEGARYHLMVLAVDGGTPSLNSSAVVTVEVE